MARQGWSPSSHPDLLALLRSCKRRNEGTKERWSKWSDSENKLNGTLKVSTLFLLVVPGYKRPKYM